MKFRIEKITALNDELQEIEAIRVQELKDPNWFQRNILRKTEPTWVYTKKVKWHHNGELGIQSSRVIARFKSISDAVEYIQARLKGTKVEYYDESGERIYE